MLTHKGTQTIETDRLILRPATAEDAAPMFRNWASDPEVTKFLTWPTHQSEEISRSVLESWCGQYKNPEFYQWMIVLKALGEPVGSISVVNHRNDIAEAEVGYCIGRAWWRKGITTEAMAAVIGYLFDQVGMNRIEAKHDVNNPNSGGVMKKCGMTFEGIARQSDRNNQGICDIATYGILRSDRK